MENKDSVDKDKDPVEEDAQKISKNKPLKVKHWTEDPSTWGSRTKAPYYRHG